MAQAQPGNRGPSQGPSRGERWPSISRYQIKRVISQSQDQACFYAIDSLVQTPVELRALVFRGTAASIQRDVAYQRVAAAAQLAHPNIGRIYEYGESEGLDYIAGEWVDDRSLAALSARAPLPVTQVLRIGAQMAAALDFAHARGVTHLNLQPEDIHVAHNDSLKILGFGLPAMALGRARYAAPELAAGKEGGPRADQYALARILRELLPGDLRAPALAVLTRATHPDPAARYETCGQLATALSAALAVPPLMVRLSSRATDRVRPASPPPSRSTHRIGVAIAAAAMLLVVLVAGAVLRNRIDPERVSAAFGVRTDGAQPALPVGGNVLDAAKPRIDRASPRDFWSLPAGDERHTNFAAAGLPSTLRLIWSQSVGGIAGDLAYVGGRVIAAVGAADVASFDATSGALRWRATLSAPPASLRIAGDAVLVTTGGNDIVALGAGDGVQRWRTAIGHPGAQVRLTADANAAYALTTDGAVLALGLSDGSVRWEKALTLAPGSAAPRFDPAAANEALIVTTDGGVYRLDARTGQLAWRVDGGAPPSTPPLISPQGDVVIVGAAGGSLRALRLFDGTTAWEIHADGPVLGMASDGERVYATLSGGTLLSVQLLDGREAWRARFADGPTAWPFTDGVAVWTLVDGLGGGDGDGGGAREVRVFDAISGREDLERRQSISAGPNAKVVVGEAGVYARSDEALRAFGP